MKLKLINQEDPLVTITLDDEQVDLDYPQLDTAPGRLSLRIDDHSDGSHTVVSPDLSAAEAMALGNFLQGWGERRAEEEQGEKRAERLVQDVQGVMDGAAKSVGAVMMGVGIPAPPEPTEEDN